MRFGSVCSGIEAASVAWHPLGWESAWLSEIEPFPCAVLKHHYPDVPNLGDMTKFKEWQIESNVDVLVGGTPCQSFSVAGLRKGLDDPRGNLMLTYLAIAKQHRPRWLVWENVPGVLSSADGRDFGSFLGGLAICGYGFAYRVLDAQYFGVAQRRKRVFVVGYLGDWRPAAAVLFERESLRGNPAPSRQKGERIAPCVTNGAPFSRTGNERVEAEAMVVADCGVQLSGPLSARDYKDPGTDGMNKISAKMVPVIHETVGALCADSHPGAYSGQDAYTGRLIPSPTYAIQGSVIGRNDKAGPQGDGINVEVCFTQNTIDRHAVAYNIAPGKGKLKNDIHVTDAYIAKTIDASGGNPSMHQGGAAIVQPVHCVDMGANKGLNGGGILKELSQPLGTNESHAIQQAMAVRRLTPIECERLQGFPDNYTDIKPKGKQTPDGPRYKALGNSMAVPVMAWIGKRIQEVENIK